jgi:GT2 family glycosyltransferase
MPGASPTISIMIPTNNLIHFTERCLLSLFDWIVRDGISQEKIEILLLDSSSEDGLPELIAHYPFWALRLVQCRKSADTHARKFNLGARRARGRFLLFLDNETEITSPLIGPLMRILDAQPSTGIVGSKYRLPNGSLEHFGIAFTREGRPANLYNNAPEVHNLFMKGRKVPAVACGCAMVRRDEFLSLGGFDPRLSLAYADADLCLRYFHELDKEAFLEAQSTLIHHAHSPDNTDPLYKSAEIHFRKKWPKSLLPLLDDLYLRDEVDTGVRDLRAAKIIAFSPQTALIDRRAFLGKTLRGDSRTIYFLFDEETTALNNEVHALYRYFASAYSDTYRVLRARPEDFPYFFESEAFTISVADNHPTRFWETRRFAQRDFRLFRARYEIATEAEVHDYWTEQIRNNQFRLFVSDDYSRSYLAQIGISQDRIFSISPCCSHNAVKHIRHLSSRRGRIRYLLHANSDEAYPRRVEASCAVCDAFSGNGNIEVAIRDFGNRPELLRRLGGRYPKGPRIFVCSGPRTRAEERELLNSADAVIDTEPNENHWKTIEAAASGVPILAPIYGSAAEFLSQAECVPLPFRLRPIGPSLTKKMLLLDESYITSRTSRKDLLRILRETAPSLRHLHIKAAAKAHILRTKYRIDGKAHSVEGHIRALQNRAATKLEIPKPRDLIYESIADKPVFSILANSYNRPEAIIRWMRHLVHLQDFGSWPTEVIILDDGSSPSYEDIRGDLLQLAKNQHCRPFAFRLVRLDCNCGNAIGRNVLIELASGKRALLMGDDILPVPGMLRRHADASLNYDSRTLLLGHTEWHPRVRNDLIAEFATKYSGFQFNYEAIRNQTEIPLTNVFTSNVSFNPRRIRTAGAYFEPVTGVSLFEDTLWGMALDRAGFRLIYDRRAEALHDHAVSYDWLCQRSQIIGRTMYRYFTLFPSSRAFTGIEGRLETIRQAMEATIVGRPDPSHYEKQLYMAVQSLMPKVLTAHSWEKRTPCVAGLHAVLYRSFEYHLMKGLISSLHMNEERKLRAIRFCITLLNKRSNTAVTRNMR